MALKLIEVAMPLKAINEACIAEKKIRSGTPANIHAWWARRPMAASRSILFAQLVDDPSAHPELFPNEEAVEKERQRLFSLMRELAAPTGPTTKVLSAAQDEIRKSVGSDITVLDPFAGGGSIPVEAQRLGLNVLASDLNPVAVLLNRFMLVQAKAATGHSAVHPEEDSLLSRRPSAGLNGLADDVHWYGKFLRDLVAEELKEFYPAANDSNGKPHAVIAWLWARTVPCPNPACRRVAPLMTNFWLSKKKGRECWLDPEVNAPGEAITFKIQTGSGTPASNGSKVGRGTKFICLGCKEPLDTSYVKSVGLTGSYGQQLVAIACLGDRRRVYLPASAEQEQAALSVNFASHQLETALVDNPRWFSPPGYGMTTHASLFTSRQLKTLTTFSDKISQVRKEVLLHSLGDEEYADIIATVLGLAVSKLSDLSNSLCWWEAPSECPRNLFTRQAIPMVWDFAEGNPFGESSGSFLTILSNTVRAIRGPLVQFNRRGNVSVSQANAAMREYPPNVVVCTDPPYFDNIGYADLADFFYVWLRLGLGSIHTDLFGTLLTPKSEELVATPYRFDGNQELANAHFESGFRDVFSRIKLRHHADIPMTVFYAYKQEDDESESDGSATGAGATGWEKLLQGMVDSGLQITATWPVRTEMASRLVGRRTNALASSVVLACRPRQIDAGITDRQGFIRHLRRVLSDKIVELHSGGVMPVDMAQASIGPGMSVFTSYSKVMDGSNSVMSVNTALQTINQILDELQSDHESDFDSDTRWALSWFDQFGMNPGPFGDAQNLATARSIAMNAIERSGIIESRSGNVRLLDRSEYPDDWDPESDKRVTVWEVCQHLIRRLDGDGGAIAAASLLRQVGGLGDAARDLSYRLYEIANRNGWADEARAYNNLAAEWPDLVALAAQAPQDSTTLF
jgi:putative DNA methylase